MKAQEFDEKFEVGEDLTNRLDFQRRVGSTRKADG